ncbi:Nn.00g043510.m01.CDS01 [Neocucurbitaria sp. VM-36]
MASARSSRAPSLSSDRPSIASSVTFQMPATVRPPPAYIAASVASQTVTDHHNAQLRQDDADSDELETAVFSEQALALLNAFLDHLLFAFLSTARSPSLTAVRPAIAEVLKPRLAREAMEAADEELQGLLAGEDDEELPAHHGKAADMWDVEKVWKRTRLRIMVYTRLGELEDEDEDRYVQQERGLSMDLDDDDEAGLVSWASAIFLTSVIEYVAEQTLLASGSAAFARMAAKQKKLSMQLGEPFERTFERLIIEEPDVEKIALNSALGRLWRTWRKRVRSPISPLSPGRGVRPVSSYSSFHTRKASHDTIDESFRSERSPIPEHVPTETEIAANIPLPLGDNDVNEIEVPGLARTFEEDAESSGTQTPVPRPQRPSSVLMLSPAETFRRRTTKERPLSMPLRPAPLFTVPPQSEPEEVEKEAETPFETSLEQPHHQDDYFEAEEHDSVPLHDKVGEKRLQDSPEPDAEMVAFAASTGMGFRMSTVGPIQNHASDGAESDVEIPSAGGYESEPKVMKSKRMSIEKTGPGIVRTFSTRSSSLRSQQPTPTATPKASQQPEGSSYLELSDDEADEHQAIGVARTSDVPIRSTPTPPVEPPMDKGKSPGHGGYVEVQPRQSGPTSVPYRSTPTPDSKPIIPERSVARKDVHGRTPSGNEIAASPSQYESPPSPPRRQDAPPPKSRGAPLPPLQEVDSATNKSQERLRSESLPRRGSPTLGSPKRTPSYPTRDAQVHVAERGVPRSSTDETARSQPGPSDRSPSDKTSLKRGASSSSSTKVSGNIAVTPSGRSSEASQRPRNLSTRMSEEDREREFDSLVKGQETVKFTLTPQNMRSLDESPVQKKVEPRRPSTSSVTVYPRVDADKDTSFGTNNLPKRTASRGTGPTASLSKSSPSRKVVSRQLAREPRIESESMRDFADFIRSTGPSPGQEKPVQPFVNISGNGSTHANASTSSLGRRISTKQTSARHLEGPSAKPRMNMEPRSPAGLTSGNDELIDFIRQGPPSTNNGQPRIPRNVAPFRTTVDSDQFDNMLGNHNNVESAFGSTSSTLDSKQSTQTVNSRTGLIPTPKVVQPAYSNTPQNLSGSMASNSEPVITKTRRRIKDPYAIDSSDDEDEDQLTALPYSSQPAQPRQERQESLMDFLNGMDPPSTSKPQPFMLSEETIAAARARAAASNSSLSSSNTATRNGNGPAQFGATSSTSLGSDGARNYNKPRLHARAPAAGDVRAGASVGKTATSDLADFLRNSGPPEPVKSAGSTRKEEEKKSRKFWRTKKTYGDLP